MRVTCGRRVRVGPGDRLVAVARLPHDSKGLGRLYVFARTLGDTDYSPYVPMLQGLVELAQPQMLSPLSLRLTSAQPQRQLSFTSDIDGWVRLMQEVDAEKDPRCAIKWTRTVSPELSYRDRFVHLLRGWREAVLPMVSHG
jgi:hypothetical protein